MWLVHGSVDWIAWLAWSAVGFFTLVCSAVGTGGFWAVVFFLLVLVPVFRMGFLQLGSVDFGLPGFSGYVVWVCG